MKNSLSITKRTKTTNQPHSRQFPSCAAGTTVFIIRNKELEYFQYGYLVESEAQSVLNTVSASGGLDPCNSVKDPEDVIIVGLQF